MLPVLNSRTALALATALIFLAGIVAGAWRYQQARAAVHESLLIKATRCAVAFDQSELSQLTATRDDLSQPAYQEIKDRLSRLQRIEPTVRLVFVLRQQADGSVVFLADSENPDSLDAAQPGQLFRQTAELPGVRATLASGEAATTGPVSDPLGTWITGFVLISDADENPRHLVGIELAVDEWRHLLWTKALGTACYVWLFLVLPLVALVSTRKQAQQRDALRNLTEAMDQGHSAVVIVDLNGRMEYANTGFCQLLGYARRELIGREWRDLQVHTAQLELAATIIADVRTGRSWSGDWMMRRKDGALLPVRGGITPVKDRHGVIRSFVAVFDDITEARRTESLLREAKERAEAGDRAKGQFLATMSHEVRTPLNGIVGFASLLLDTELTPEQQEYVETIRTSSETLIQLTGDILDYARIESGRLKLEPQPCDPRECVESALDLVAANAVQKNIELLHWVEDGVPATIVADVSRLRQVVVNLVNNAVKFTTDGEVEVRLRLTRIDPPVVESASPSKPPIPVSRCVLEFSVRDTGIGIAPEHHHKIFRPFSQVDESTTRRYGGTGLGLAICKNIVELMDGSITFTSEPGRGSTFTFTIHVPLHTPHRPFPQPLEDQRVAVVAKHSGLQDELSRIATRLGADPFATELMTLAVRDDWQLAIVDVSGPAAMEIAARREPNSALPAERMIALVPIVLPTELRTALRPHFRLVLNKPLHHDMFASLVATPIAPVLPSSAAPISPTPAPSSEAPPESAATVIAEDPPRFDLRVLIVEDNAVNQRLIQKVISKLGCEWTTAHNGRAALDELARSKPDVVLMDLHMPELDGLTATTKIRAGEAGADAKDVWIIALTADAREEQRERTLGAGANDYLTKPVQLAQVTTALQRFLATRRK